MKKLNYDIIYFIGIGGIGMSALARWFKAANYQVLGYDKTATPLTHELAQEGIEVHYQEDISFIPYLATPKNTLVVYTPAVPAAHAELTFFKSKGYTLLKRAQVLGEISKHYFTVAVAGTHGKTTTTSMIAHLLYQGQVDVTAFIGGISVNFNGNLVLGKTPQAIAVIEADEFDRSFLQLHPNLAVVTSTDADHLDIYSTKEELQASFSAFVNLLPTATTEPEPEGKLLVADKANASLNLEQAVVYGLNKAQVSAKNITTAQGQFVFDYGDEETEIIGLALRLPGFHNVENALAAIKVALWLGVPAASIKNGISSYRGGTRRFEFKYTSEQKIYITDYAHHPEELNAFISSVKALYQGKKLLLIFQPHLYSRTRDFAQEFANALNQAHHVWLMDIYPAREEPIEGVNAQLIASLMKNPEVPVMNNQEILHQLPSASFDVLATVGAGDIDRLVPEIKSLFLKNECHA